MMALTAFAAAAAFTTGFAGTAQAGSPAAPASGWEATATRASGAESAAVQSPGPLATAVCTAVADENRAVWAQPATGPTVGGVIAGRTYNAECALVPGATYTACGATTDHWAYINYAGDNWGYLPSTCLTWAS
jgi:hypothetical protein